jgi:hypothetical protein
MNNSVTDKALFKIKILNLVKESVLKRITPISIILGGSFGRSEESLLISQDELTPLRDMDIYLIVKRRWPSHLIKSINKEVNSMISYRYADDEYRFNRFTITALQLPLHEVIFSNDIKAYDIKYASELVHGKDLRHKIRVSRPDQIAKFSAVRVLLNKILGLYFIAPINSFFRQDRSHEKMRIIMECAKTYIEIGTASCLLDGKYVPSYEERIKVISTISWLQNRLKDHIVEFTKLKLQPSLSVIDGFDCQRLWLQTRKDLLAFLFSINHRLYKLRYDGRIFNYADKMANTLQNHALSEYAEFYLKHRFGISNKRLSNFISWLYQIYFAYIIMKQLRSQGITLRMRALWASPLFDVYSQGLILLASIREDFSVSEQGLKEFLRRLKTISSSNRLLFSSSNFANNVASFTTTRKILSLLFNNIVYAHYGG